jgi:large subunit ribosomal protein L29
MKAQDLREMSQILTELEALERRVFDLRTQSETEDLKVPSELLKARRDIARMRTILRQREAAAGAPSAPPAEEKPTA